MTKSKTHILLPSLVCGMLLAVGLAGVPTAGATHLECSSTPSNGVGRYSSTAFAGSRTCHEVYANAGDLLLITLRRTDGEAPTVAGEVYNPDGQIVNSMQFSSFGNTNVHYCTVTSPGWYTLKLGAINGDSVGYRVTIDTTTQIVVAGNGPYADSVNHPVGMVASVVIFAGSAGMCIST